MMWQTADPLDALAKLWYIASVSIVHAGHSVLIPQTAKSMRQRFKVEWGHPTLLPLWSWRKQYKPFSTDFLSPLW